MVITFVIARTGLVSEPNIVRRVEEANSAGYFAPIRRSLSIGRFNDRPRPRISAHTSPTFAMRSGIVRSVKVAGFTLPRSISSHLHGADTGAPGFARTV